MDVSIFVESWREGVKSGMRKEPTIKKVIIASGGLATLLVSLIIGSYQMSYWGNTVNMQNNYDITQIYNNTENPYMNSTYYDIAYIDGPFVNMTEANELKLKINETCDVDCIAKGSEWSIIYAFAGFVGILMAINSLFLIFGGWVYRTRMIGIFCHDFLTLMALCSFIVTWRYRYRDQGKLAAMSTMPSHLKSETEYDLTWTYQDDAKFIHTILIWQGVAIVLFICTGNLGCFKLMNKTDYRDSQVGGSFRNSTLKVRAPPQQQQQDDYDNNDDYSGNENQQQLLSQNDQ